MKITVRLRLILIPVFSVFGLTSLSQAPVENIKKSCLEIHHLYLTEAFTLTKNCVGFSAPVSGRAYGYISLGIYESVVDLLPELQSLEGQLNGYKRTESSQPDELNWMLVVNSADHALLSYFYRNMPPSNEEHLNALHDSLVKVFKKKSPKKIRNISIEYGRSIAQAIIDWSKSDGADDGFDRNYPESFTPPVCDSCWTKTFPGYLPSLVPYWGANRPMVSSSQAVAYSMEPFPYSTEQGSIMYNEALKVLNNGKDQDPQFEKTAEYWDDAPGYSGTPSGHFFTIAQTVAMDEGLSLEKAVELYVKLGIAVNEAFISSFYLKYKFNFIRPITYIQRHIDPNFNTRLASPPFPEYPSGHSFQSGAASEIMKSVFGDSITFTDRTNSWRTDIDGSPRTYGSFTEMSEEISISRFYGGIHFQLTLDRSLDYGRKIGNHIAKEIQCRKQ